MRLPADLTRQPGAAIYPAVPGSAHQEPFGRAAEDSCTAGRIEPERADVGDGLLASDPGKPA